MTQFPYQIGLLGHYEPHRAPIEAAIAARFGELGLVGGFKVLVGHDVTNRERRAPFVAVFFGYDGAARDSQPILDDVLADSVVVLPIASDGAAIPDEMPTQLIHINALTLDVDPNFHRATSTLLESFRLLRQDRRLFISYKRDDSRAAALQLYDALESRGFDVFLDTHGVPPAKDFQSILWHRLADSDVVVMLDTPHFLTSRWTQEELARANATNIQILNVLWPGQKPSPATALAHFLPLDSGMFLTADHGKDGLLTAGALAQVVDAAESLRARAITLRHRYLVDAFCDEARARGLTTVVQTNRHIILSSKKRTIIVVPMVGVPSALRLYDVDRELLKAASGAAIWALYDERGLLAEIVDHVSWLNTNLPLQAVAVFEVNSRLSSV